MTSLKQIRKAALSLPEVEEAKSGSRVGFEVRSKPFAVVDQGELTVWLPAERAEEVRRDHPQAMLAERGGSPFGIRIPLAAIKGMHSNALVRDAWSHRAPRSLARPVVDAESADHALPSEIGRPATRALVGAGITTVDDVAARSKEEILDLHGVGPSALRVLEKHLADSGRTWTK